MVIFVKISDFNIFSRFNNRVDKSKDLLLPSFSRDNTLGIVVGNSKAFWDPFIHFLKSRPDAKQIIEGDPIEFYTKFSIESVLKEHNYHNILYKIIYSHEKIDGKYLAIQRLANWANLASLHSKCYLSIHPTFGPWIALRYPNL